MGTRMQVGTPATGTWGMRTATQGTSGTGETPVTWGTTGILAMWGITGRVDPPATMFIMM
jgi:hypothetical protein